MSDEKGADGSSATPDIGVEVYSIAVSGKPGKWEKVGNNGSDGIG